MRNRGLLIFIARVAAVPLCAGMVLLYVGLELSITALWIIGLIALAAGVPVIVCCIVLLSRPDRKTQRRWKAYSSLPESKITDYAAEINEVKCRYTADDDTDKNIVPKPHFSGANGFCDYSVLKHGQIYYGCMVQANDQMFEVSSKADQAWFAVFIYSRDEFYNNNPLELIKVARKLSADRANNRLRCEMQHEFNTLIDTSLTDGREVFMTDMLIYREHLPLGKLGIGKLMPIIANPDLSDSAFVVDCKYWSDSFIYDYIHGLPKSKNTEQKEKL